MKPTYIYIYILLIPKKSGRLLLTLNFGHSSWWFNKNTYKRPAKIYTIRFV